MSYTVDLRARSDDDSLDTEYGWLKTFAEMVAEYGGAAAAGSTDSYEASFNVVTDSMVNALIDATDRFVNAAKKARLPEWAITYAEVVTDAELDRMLAIPNYPTLVGVAELAEILDVSKQRASQLSKSSRFPPPFQTLKSGPVWDRHAVMSFLEHWDRKPGRPKSVAAGQGE